MIPELLLRAADQGKDSQDIMALVRGCHFDFWLVSEPGEMTAEALTGAARIVFDACKAKGLSLTMRLPCKTSACGHLTVHLSGGRRLDAGQNDAD